MDFEEFNAKSEGLVAKIKEQNPLAIIRFGSSNKPEDYIPDVSDLDLVVVSQEPIKDTSNEVGFEYFFNHPNKFVTDCINGNPFTMNALFNGEVVYDPNKFIERFKELSERGLVLGPTKNTLYQIVQSIGNQLSSSMNRYFSKEFNGGNKAKLLRNAHSAVRGIGSSYILTSSGELPDGYNDILSKLGSSQPELTKILKSTREYLINHKEVSPKKSSGVKIGDDELGQIIQSAEQAYVSDAPIVNVRAPTNNLIESYQSQIGKIDQTLAVRINNGEFNHLILGNQQDKNYIFGLVGTNEQQPKIADQEVPKEQLQEIYSQLKILR